MAKYEKLTEFLDSQKTPSRRLSFRDIEKVLGFILPASARNYPAWWSNDPSPGRHSSAWLRAGWETADVDLGSERVTFLRRGAVKPECPLILDKPASPARAVRATDVIDAAPSGKEIELSVTMQWQALGSIAPDANGGILFPAAPGTPGLYRFRLTGAGEPRSYIGETTNLRRRFHHYRNPGPTQATNIRLNAILRDHLAAGGTAAVDIITADIRLVLGGSPAPIDLDKKPIRRLLEQAALVAEDGQPIDSLNR